MHDYFSLEMVHLTNSNYNKNKSNYNKSYYK